MPAQVTQVDFGSLFRGGQEFSNDYLTFTGAGTVVAGTILARDSVSLKVKKRCLIINADGDGSNVDNAVLDQLRTFGITSVDVFQSSY